MLHPVTAALAALLAALPALLAALAADDGCLSCLCQAATGCDVNRDCDAATCGMFAISRQYWKDAGEPGGDFETCALDPACATQCVQAYLQRFARDCNADGAVGCSDYGRLHHLGREGCGGALDADFARRLDACNASIPLGDFYARAVARPARQGRQGNSWNGGGYPAPRQPSGGSPAFNSWSGGGNTAPQQPSNPTLNFSPSLSLSRTVTVNPTYQGGSSPGNQGGYERSRGYQGGGYQGGGYQSGATGYNSVSGYQGGATGYNSVSGYQSGYEESGGSSLWSGRRRVGGHSTGGGYGQSGWTGAYGQQGSVLWGAGEGYRPSSGGVHSRNGAVSASRGVPANCLTCICNALTGCDPYADCSNGGCGAFKLSPAYWRDCGSPGQSYEYCTRDYSCSSSCVQAYVYKYAQDCDGDGVVDCRDYARIHRLGGFGCRGSLDWAYQERVDACSAY